MTFAVFFSETLDICNMICCAGLLEVMGRAVREYCSEAESNGLLQILGKRYGPT